MHAGGARHPGPAAKRGGRHEGYARVRLLFFFLGSGRCAPAPLTAAGVLLVQLAEENCMQICSRTNIMPLNQ